MMGCRLYRVELYDSGCTMGPTLATVSGWKLNGNFQKLIAYSFLPISPSRLLCVACSKRPSFGVSSSMDRVINDEFVVTPLPFHNSHETLCHPRRLLLFVRSG